MQIHLVGRFCLPICVCVCVYTRECTKSTSGVFLKYCPPWFLFFEIRFLLVWSSLIRLRWLAGEPQGPACLCFVSVGIIKCVSLCMPGFSPGLCILKLRTSYFYGKHFTISSDLFSYKNMKTNNKTPYSPSRRGQSISTLSTVLPQEATGETVSGRSGEKQKNLGYSRAHDHS